MSAEESLAAAAQELQQQQQQQQQQESDAPPEKRDAKQEEEEQQQQQQQQQQEGGGRDGAAEPPAHRCLVLTGYGGYDKVKLQQLRGGPPAPAKGHVLVRVKACGLNFADLMARQGLYERLPSPPVTPGMECSGVVEALGEEVHDRRVGDKVLVLHRCGLWQEVAVVPANHTFLMPEGMSFEEAAAIPVNYITAYMMLFDFGNLRPHQSVLVHMAAGGVGIAATQLCKTVEDVTVFGTASASKHEVISQGGVTHAIDYRSRDYVEEVRKHSPKGVNIVLDPLGGLDTQKAFNLLKPMGRVITYGAANVLTGPKKNLLALAKTWYNQFSISAHSLLHSNKAVCGFHLGYLDAESELLSGVMDELLKLYGQGKIKPRVDSTYHFEQVGDAMRRMQERHNIGKVILLPEPKKEAKKEEPKTEEAKKEGN